MRGKVHSLAYFQKYIFLPYGRQQEASVYYGYLCRITDTSLDLLHGLVPERVISLRAQRERSPEMPVMKSEDVDCQ
jgi:hypothetical protein